MGFELQNRSCLSLHEKEKKTFGNRTLYKAIRIEGIGVRKPKVGFFMNLLRGICENGVRNYGKGFENVMVFSHLMRRHI